MNGITNLHGMNKKHEETNYCIFDNNRKLKATKDCIFIHAKSGLKLLHSLFLRWWLSSVKCQTSNLVSDSNDQKLNVVPSLTKFWSFLDLHRYCLLLFYFVNSWKKLLLTYLEIQVRARNIMMADAQTDYLNDYWTNCKTATRNLSGDWLRC